MAIEVISEIQLANRRTFPIVDSNNIKGGLYTVNSLLERDLIPEERLKIGMMCYVLANEKYYKLKAINSWEEAKFGGEGVPIYDQLIYDELYSKESLPDKFISIPNKFSDLGGNSLSRQIPKNGTYVDILFSAIRKLLSEVAKIRNSFNYGLYSYTDTNTAMSNIVNGIEDPDEEPLWCIEEEDLSLIESLTIGNGTELFPQTNIEVGTGILTITGEATWLDSNTILRDTEDPKIFMYLTTTNLDTNIKLKSEETTFILNPSTLNVFQADAYNIMVCINRRINDAGTNYIYISIGDATSDRILKEGYFNGNSLQNQFCSIDNPYYFSEILFKDTILSKLNFYSKYLDFSKQVIPSAPSEQDYKYKVAHLTIRSVESENVLKQIQTQLPNNELIFVENSNKLWIKNNDKLIAIGAAGGSSSDPEIDNTGMTQQEVIDLLISMGIVKNDAEGLQINDLADLTFIHQETNLKFKLSVNSEGELVSTKLPDKTIADRLKLANLSFDQIDPNLKFMRGFISNLRLFESGKVNEFNKLNLYTLDAGLHSDRLKIGAFYAPKEGDTVFGCSRAFIELENTADCDFALEGCYLHLTKPGLENGSFKQTVYHLPLTGTIKAGSTYLIVGKKYAENSDSNVYLKIDSFDQEWFVDGELIDFTFKGDDSYGYGFALTYQKPDLQPTEKLWEAAKNGYDGIKDSADDAFTYKLVPYFIDALYYNKAVIDDAEKGYWANYTVSLTSNSMYRNMFLLDPAKQAFQSTNTKDSSRTRWQSGNDVWIMDLSKKYIQFPHSEDVCDISLFTPKSSKQNRNISTDKTKLNMDKPNSVYCTFGVDIYKDRCFNWVSVGYYDEFVWIRKQGESTWTKFESYKTKTSSTKTNWSDVTDYPVKKEYETDFNNLIYARMTGRFPGDNTFYTAHKCVLRVTNSNVTAPETWEYKVGRSNQSNLPDENHTSDIQTFTLYPQSYKPVIYLLSDQQGFHWIEYQVWAAAATEVLNKIESDKAKNNIIPIVINTGDVTQNGTRVNEWLDFYNAGRVLFSKYEHMSVVGNNDLCDIDPTILGTGDDRGKSNSYYFHVFNCFDINSELFSPIVNNKYIPSFYYFDTTDFRLVMLNSEITKTTCANWYKLNNTDHGVVNIYTGFNIEVNNVYCANSPSSTFTPIYTMVYNIFNDAKTKNKNIIAACHEIPFTVITRESLAISEKEDSRSVNEKNSLVGCHMNLISNVTEKNGLYWFSRLLEYFNVKLCLGGHKHTYTCTFPIRENFTFTKNGTTYNSETNYSEYTMTDTLEHDNVSWETTEGSEKIHTSKFPLTKKTITETPEQGFFFPVKACPDLTGGVVYFMCQATGYKLTSNKELPSANQLISEFLPKTFYDPEAKKSNPDGNQQRPMFAIIRLDKSNSNALYTLQLVRINGILTDNKYKFTQTTYSKNNMTLDYLRKYDEVKDSTLNADDTTVAKKFGIWDSTENNMLIIQ